MTHSPIDVAVNPNNQAQRYILWTNGRIDNIGGAPPITGPGWYDRLDTVAMALHITNWTTGAGYVLDWQGGFNSVGGAPDLMTEHVQYPLPSVPGVPYQTFRCYVDWSWDPSGNGQGYVVDLWGQIYAFGGATAAPRSGPRFNDQRVRRIQVQWSGTRRGVIMDMFGGLYGEFGLSLPTNLGNRVNWNADWARDFTVTNWAAAPIAGYTLDMHGETHPWGGAPVSGAPGGVWQNSDVARTLFLLSTADPVRMWQVWSGGQQFEYLLSDPPTVVAGGGSGSPASSVTTTTRPELTWSYSDPQSDSQTAWQLLVFTQAFVDGHNMANPLAWVTSALMAQEGLQRTARGVTPSIDFPNGSYRMYVRAQDSSGKWSAWSNRGWTQAVSMPGAPSNMTATPVNGSFAVNLSVQTSAGVNADFVRFDKSDDDGITWSPVVGAEAIPLMPTTTAVDRTAPLGRERLYRATSYATSPRVASPPSAAVGATLTRLCHVLTAIDDPSIGGEVHAVDPAEWTRPVDAGVFQGIGATYATVVSDGSPKGRRMTLHVMPQDRAEWEQVEALAMSNSVLLHRDPFGDAVFCRLVGDWSRRQLPAAPLQGEVTPLRHLHATDLPLVEVAPPSVS